MNKKRKFKLNENYVPLPTYEGDEIYRNGIFHFNISRIYDQIDSGILVAEFGQIDVIGWFKTHLHKRVNENHLPSVDISRTILQAEIRPGMFEVIDGNHRIERAFREGVLTINSYKLKGEQLLPFFTNIKGYNAFIDYWNSKLL